MWSLSLIIFIFLSKYKYNMYIKSLSIDLGASNTKLFVNNNNSYEKI